MATALSSALICVPAGATSMTYQNDVAHTGNVPAQFGPPLGKKWIRRDLGLGLSYPVIGEGKVFLTAKNGDATLLYALDRRTGHTIWVRPAPKLGLPAYDSGRVFVAGEKSLGAYSATNGQPLWLLGHPAISSAPVPDGGLVYVSDDEGISAYEEASGAPAALTQDGWGAQSGIGVTDARVYSARGCSVAAFSKALGRPIWNESGACQSYGAYPPAIYRGRVYVRGGSGEGFSIEANLALNSEAFPAWGPFAFSGNLVYSSTGEGAEARRIDTGTIAWTRKMGSGRTPSAILVVGRALYTLGGDGTVSALDPATGRIRWSTPLAVPTDPYYGGDDHYLYGGMAADGAGLIVPTDTRLVALGPGRSTPGVDDPDKYPARSTHLSTSISDRWATYRRRLFISGRVTRASYPAYDRLELQATNYPYRVWRRIASQRSRDTGFLFRVRPERNTRYRVVDIDTGPAVRSRAIQVRIYIGIKARAWAGPNSHVRVDVKALAPPFLHLEKNPMYVYRFRTMQSRGSRLGGVRVHRTGHAKYHARGSLYVPQLHQSDLFLICFPVKQWHQIGQYRHPDDCGRRRLAPRRG